MPFFFSLPPRRPPGRSSRRRAGTLRPTRSGFTFLEMLLIMVVVALAAALMLPVLSRTLRDLGPR
jgi:Tfp pilus assembly protein FimT